MVDGVETTDKDGGNGDNEAIDEAARQEGGDDLSAAFNHEAINTTLAEMAEKRGKMDSAVFVGSSADDVGTILLQLSLAFRTGLEGGGDPGRL